MLSRLPGMKRVLLTGGTGFIGCHTIPELLKRKFEVHLADICRKPPFSLPKKVILHPCDLLDARQQKKILKEVRPTHLLHLAWYTVPGKYWNSEENIRWVQASLELLQNFVGLGGRRLVFAGSCAEYDWTSGFCSEFQTPLIPKSLYGTAKNSLHQICAAFCRERNISYAWGRIFFLFGPHEAPTRLVPSVIRVLLQNREAPCTQGLQKRDFMHVADVAAAFVAILDSKVQGPVNIASGRAVSVKEVAEKIASKLGKRHLLKLGALPAPRAEPLVLKADIRRLRREVGWRPRFNLDRGLDEAIAWHAKDMGKTRMRGFSA